MSGADDMTSRVEALERRCSELEGELSSARRELERARERLRGQARLAWLGQLVAGVAHELKNPANFVYGGATALVERIEALSEGGDAASMEKLLRLAAVVRTGGERIRDLTEALNVGRGRRGGGQRRELSLHNAARSAAALLEPQARGRQVSLKVDVAPELSLQGDRGEIYQVISNVMLNAVQASPAEGVVEVTAWSRGGEVALVVSDQGPGVPPEAVGRIFEPFYSTKAPSDGTGLGLSICRSIMDQQGGRIDVEPGAGGGAVFSIIFRSHSGEGRDA